MTRPRPAIAASPSQHWSTCLVSNNIVCLRSAYGLLMGLIIIVVLVRILEGMFVVGAVGSVVVLVLSGIEDLKLLFGREEQNHS
jgi:hypothetical protein